MNQDKVAAKADLGVRIVRKSDKYLIIGIIGCLSSLASIMYIGMLMMGFIDPSTTLNYFMMLVVFISLPSLKYAILGLDNKGIR